MPYICLARTDIPDGTVQILDLKPNTSQRNTSIDPPGQTRYVNRALNQIPIPRPNGTTHADVLGISAYLADRVASGGMFATGTVTMVGPFVGGETVDLKTAPVTFTGILVDRAPGSQDFNVAGTLGHAGDQLAAAINDPVTQALLLAAVPVAAGSVTAVSNGAGVVTLTSTVAGPNGALTALACTALLITVSGATLTQAAPAVPWTEAALTAASAALLARVDGGLGLTLANVNTALGVVNATLTGGGSTGVLTELLSILSGRGYMLPAGSQKMTGAPWSAVQAGKFTETVLQFGTTWNSGEIKPAVIGGDPVEVETKPIRHTYDSTHFQISLGQGHLFTFQNGVTLFPLSATIDEGCATSHEHYPWLKHNQHPEVKGARVVTVYNDDGSLA